MGEKVKFTEDSYEQALISQFKELGYEYECGYDVERDKKLPYHKADLLESLKRLNPEYNDDVIEQGIVQVTNINMVWMEQKFFTHVLFLPFKFLAIIKILLRMSLWIKLV